MTTSKKTTTRRQPEETQETAVAVRRIDPKSIMRYEPTDMEQAWKLAKTLASSEMIPVAFRGKPQDCLIVMMRGAELGLTTMRSFELLYPVGGKIGMMADLIVGQVLQSGVCEYFDLVHSDEKKATYVTKRKGASREVELSYTIEQARTAGLLNRKGEMWIKNPHQMLRARSATDLCRAVYRDVIAGMYTPDELRSGVVEVDAELAPEEAPETLVDRSKAAADIYRGKKRSKAKAKAKPARPTKEEAEEIINEIMPPDEDEEIVDAEEIEGVEEVVEFVAPEEAEEEGEDEAPEEEDEPEEEPEPEEELESEAPASADTISDDHVIELAQLCKTLGRKFKHICEFAEDEYDLPSIDDLPIEEFDEFVKAYKDFVSAEEAKAKK